MIDTMRDALKHENPKEFITQDIINSISIYKLAWSKEEWRDYFSKHNYISFRPIPIGLIFDPNYALLSNPAKLTLNYALTQVWWQPTKNNRQVKNRTSANISIDIFMMPIAALQALGIGSKPTCIKAIKELVDNNYIKLLTNKNKTNVYKLNTQFSLYLMSLKKKK